MKNRMREICTSGSVRGGGGNVPTYSAFDAPEVAQASGEGGGFREAGKFAEEAEVTSLDGSPQFVEKEPSEDP